MGTFVECHESGTTYPLSLILVSCCEYGLIRMYLLHHIAFCHVIMTDPLPFLRNFYMSTGISIT